jgi:UDP-2-acetamido-2,6-beta-L-arabino-hexul-4-ose reductase
MQLEIKELAIFSDKRGWLTEILNGAPGQRIENIHYTYSEPGAVRGNHYHQHSTEWLCVTCGSARIIFEDNITKERKELIVSGDSPVLVKIPPKITHAIENCASEPMHLLVIANEKRSLTDSDTYPRQLISPATRKAVGKIKEPPEKISK